MENKAYKKFLVDDTEYETTFSTKFIKRTPYKKADKRIITAFIPGIIQNVYIKKGDRIKAGDKLLVLEAMKMKNDVISPVDGIVKDVSVKEGSVVAKNELLILID